MKHLVIVESPAKAKTIAKYLGKDYEVKSSFGHIRDLTKKGLNIDIENNFEPTYAVSAEKKKVVAELKKAAAGAEVWLASDEDREGEAIAWHLCQALKLDPAKTKRIVFHEITKPAIEAAVKNPRTVDIKLVDAQQARRVLDRLVGYELSPVLWKKVQTGLSAGRVQSVAVRLIVEREREIRAFEADSQYKVIAVFTTAENEEVKAELDQKIPEAKTAREILENSATASFNVKDIGDKPGTRNPGPPFTTSSLQQEASRKLGYSVRQTMSLAQRLYENGHITYMRTDSTVISNIALAAAHNYIAKEYGEKYAKTRQFKTKNQSAQEAHEAIRPTDFSKLAAGSDEQEQKLYRLIWQRALASQMAPAQILQTEAVISSPSITNNFIAKGEVLKFDGFMKVYGGTKDDIILPPLKVGESLKLTSAEAKQTFARSPARYSEAALVKKLEELGIGRPSTYAPTISTIQDRGYVEKRDLEGEERQVTVLTLDGGQVSERVDTERYGADRNKLLPTHLAEMVTDFLLKYFGGIIDYDFTARAENDFDEIAEGKLGWQAMIAAFYKDFHPLVIATENVTREETSQARLLGNDPKDQRPIYARYGRYGPMLQRGEKEDQNKPDFAPLPKDSSLETVTLEEALVMFELPRTVGTTKDGKEIKANIGRFGPYIQVEKLFVSIKDLDPHTITEAQARELYEAKLTEQANKYIAQFKSGIKVVNGQYGPYVTNGKKNAKIPKGTKPEDLTEADCKELLEKAPAKKRFVRRKAKK